MSHKTALLVCMWGWGWLGGVKLDALLQAMDDNNAGAASFHTLVVIISAAMWLASSVSYLKLVFRSDV